MTGLALAFRRNQNPAPGDDILVLEEGPTFGGSLRTLREEGLILEAGPHTLRATAPAERLIADLDLAGDVLVADPKAPRWIVRNGRPRAITPGPAGLFTSAIPFGAKIRALKEPFVAPRSAATGDESVHDFFSRRFGAGVARYAAGPYVAGTWADDPKTLSTRSAFPALWDAEAREGSLLRAFLKAPGPAGPRVRTVSFRDGLSAIAERLAQKSQRAGVRVELNAEVEAIEGPFDREEAGCVWKVQIADGTVYPADTLVSTFNAPNLAALLGPRLPRSATRLAALSYSRLALVLQAFRLEARTSPPRGFGVLVPREEGFRSLGILYLSSLFPERVPEGLALTTSFFGGALDPALADLTEGDLLKLAESEMRRLHPTTGPRVHERVLKWPAALPRLPLGHHTTLDLLSRDLVELNAGSERPRLVVTGSWRDGLGLSERIARADELAPTL